MSKCMPKDAKFIVEMTHAAAEFYNIRDIRCYYDADPVVAKRDYVLQATVWDWDKDYLKLFKDELRSKGATAIIGGIKHAIARDYIDIAFNKKENWTTD